MTNDGNTDERQRVRELCLTFMQEADGNMWAACARLRRAARFDLQSVIAALHEGPKPHDVDDTRRRFRKVGDLLVASNRMLEMGRAAAETNRSILETETEGAATA